MLLTSAMIAHDLRTLRRVHRATAVGWTAFWGIAGALALSATEFGQRWSTRFA